MKGVAWNFITAFLDFVLTFYMAVAPDATEEELSYAEKWRYVIQLRCVCIIVCM